MIITSWVLTAFVILIISWWMFRSWRTTVIAIMIANYAVIVPLGGAATFMISQTPQCTAGAGIIAALTWFIFIFLLVLILVPFRKWFLVDRLKQPLEEIHTSMILLAVTAWWIVKLWLLLSYGIESLMVLRGVAEGQTPFSYMESTIDMVTNNILMGSIIATLLRFAWMKISWPMVAVVGITFVVASLIGDVHVGVRRALVAMILFYLSARISEVGIQRCRKEIIITAMISAAIFVYYPFIRFNIYDPTVLSDLNSGRAISAITNMLKPNPDALENGMSDVMREGVAQLHCRLNERQLSTVRLSWGAVSGDALYIALPAFIASNKLEKNPDLRLAEEHDLYPEQAYLNLDLSANPLIQLQSDFGPLALPLAAVLQAIALLLGCVIVSRKVAGLTKLLALALTWMVITSTEASLTQMVVSMRDLVLLGCVSEVLSRWFLSIKGIFRVSISRQSTTLP